MALKPCIFTNTKDEHFILDLHPDYPRVAVAAGFSGHGFKFCSVVGEIMTDLVLDGKSKLNGDMFRIVEHRARVRAGCAFGQMRRDLPGRQQCASECDSE